MCWEHDSAKYPNVKNFFDTFGIFVFEFGDADTVEYEWRPEDYLFSVQNGKNFYCFGLESIR